MINNNIIDNNKTKNNKNNNNNENNTVSAFTTLSNSYQSTYVDLSKS